MKRILSTTLLLIIVPLLTIILLKDKKTQQILEIAQKKIENAQQSIFKIEKNENVRVFREQKNQIETIPLEEYLVGVLAGEMPVSYDIEALKAQAVAARTYTLKKIKTNKQNEYDVVDTTNDQVYLDETQLKNNWQNQYEENIKKIEQAINETKGEYITYKGEIIKAFFFSTSSGKTENCEDVFGEELPYLVSVASIWDENSPSYEKTEIYTKQDFYNKLGLPYEEVLNIEIKRNETNSINTIKINNNEIIGTDFRKKLGLRSTNVEINEENNKIKITSKGYGHGVGLSQYGAKEMANLGYKYNEILKYYYKGIDIKKI